MLTPKPKVYSSDWSPGMVVLKNVPNQDWTPKSSTKLLGLTHSNALNKQTYVRLFFPRGFLARTELLDIFCPYKIGYQWKENNLGPQ